jgi:uncharacterized phage-associated protein
MAHPTSWNPLLYAAAETLRNCPGSTLKIVVLNKALFYSDLLHLLEEGETITRRPYIALKAGPVVAGYERHLVRDLINTRAAEKVVTTPRSKPIRLLHTVETNLTSAQKEIIERVASWAGKKTSAEVSRYSHENLGWKSAWDGQNVGAPINMSLAMQQVADDEDLWMQEPLTGSERAATESEERTEW